MNKFVRNLMDSLFYVNRKYMFQQVLFVLVLSFISPLILLAENIIFDKKYDSSFELLVTVTLLLSLFSVFFYLIWFKQIQFFQLGGLITFIGLLFRNGNIINIGVSVWIVGLIILILYYVGDLIVLIKKEWRGKKK